LIEHQIIDYVRATVVHAGGIMHLRRIADLAALYQVRTGCHEVFPHAYRFETGFMFPGEAPGHGVEIDEALAAKYPYRRAYLPVNRLQRDGTLWDW